VSPRSRWTPARQPSKLPPYMHPRPLLVSLLLVCATIGCKTQPPEPAPPECESLACVEITGYTPIEIARTISAVFREAGYQPAPLPANTNMMLMFEKEGSTSEMLVYGDWSGKKLWQRARIHIKSRDQQRHMVECDVFRVLDHGDPRFEEESKLSRLKRKPYQQLLDEVKTRLNSTQPTPAAQR
jgi:hypothetical protein